MIELGKVYIPTLLDFDPENKKITFKNPEIHSKEYFENIQYSLQLHISGSGIFIIYYGEDDSYLSEVLDIEESYIAYGNLNNEKFSKVQERALKVLGNYIIDSQRELLDLFNEDL